MPGTSDTSVTHNGVTWTKTQPTGAIESSTSKVEITGAANIYRTKFTSGGQSSEYQTHFGTTGAGKAGTAKQVNIKITINKTSTTGY